MQQFKSSFLKEALWRGLIHQGTNLEGLDHIMASHSITAYIGFDATAKSLHVGSLIRIMWLRLLQKHGHKPIILMGDGTTRIGDPTGKDTQRQILNDQEIDANVISIQEVFSKYLKLGDNLNDAIILKNSEWLLPLNYLEFLGRIGRYFSINRMLTFDSVRQRLEREQPLSFLEFNYMILQGYDFLHLNNQYDCLLQLGGSDQWGNIVNGTELIRRVNGKEAFGLTSPLLTTADGKKMGKSEGGAIWLRGDMLSAYDFWQYWRNVHDGDVERFIKLFTDLEASEIEKLMRQSNSDINQLKRRLADEVTAMCHGSEVLPEVHATVAHVFEKTDNDISLLPVFKLNFNQECHHYLLIDLLKSANLATSNAEARRLIRGQAVKLNNVLIENETFLITKEFFADKIDIILSVGRKRHIVLRII